MLDLYSDGCIVPNIRTQTYRVTLHGKCSHTKIVRAEITVTAISAESAVNYVQTWLRTPQTVVTDVTQVIA